jgi:hypothetical protein
MQRFLGDLEAEEIGLDPIKDSFDMVPWIWLFASINTVPSPAGPMPH